MPMSSDPAALHGPDFGAGGETLAAATSRPPESPGATWACFAVCLAGLVTLVAIALSNNALWNDEKTHLAGVPTLHRLGLSGEFLRALPGAPGPLFAMIHALFEPLTGLKAPGVRIVNIGLSLVAIAALGAAMRSRGVPHAFPKALALIGAPMIWGPIGTAITEMPAVMFFCISLALMFAALERAERRAASAYPLAALAGLACALAVMGRQQFLMIPIASVVLWRRTTWRVGLIFALIAAGLPTPIFLAWGGLVPPPERRFEAGLSIIHGLSAFSYAGVIYCLYDVGWLLRRWRGIAAVVALTTAANIATGAVEHHPFHILAAEHLSTTGLHYYALATSGVMLGFGAAFFVLLAQFAWERRDDPAGLFACAAAAALLGGSIKIAHMFAGRYITSSIPLLVLLGSERAPDTYGKALRLALGCIGGALSLLTYLRTG